MSSKKEPGDLNSKCVGGHYLRRNANYRNKNYKDFMLHSDRNKKSCLQQETISTVQESPDNRAAPPKMAKIDELALSAEQSTSSVTCTAENLLLGTESRCNQKYRNQSATKGNNECNTDTNEKVGTKQVGCSNFLQVPASLRDYSSGSGLNGSVSIAKQSSVSRTTGGTTILPNIATLFSSDISITSIVSDHAPTSSHSPSPISSKVSPSGITCTKTLPSDINLIVFPPSITITKITPSDDTGTEMTPSDVDNSKNTIATVKSAEMYPDRTPSDLEVSYDSCSASTNTLTVSCGDSQTLNDPPISNCTSLSTTSINNSLPTSKCSLLPTSTSYALPTSNCSISTSMPIPTSSIVYTKKSILCSKKVAKILLPKSNEPIKNSSLSTSELSVSSSAAKNVIGPSTSLDQDNQFSSSSGATGPFDFTQVSSLSASPSERQKLYVSSLSNESPSRPVLLHTGNKAGSSNSEGGNIPSSEDQSGTSPQNFLIVYTKPPECILQAVKKHKENMRRKMMESNLCSEFSPDIQKNW